MSPLLFAFEPAAVMLRRRNLNDDTILDVSGFAARELDVPVAVASFSTLNLVVPHPRGDLIHALLARIAACTPVCI